MPQRTIARRRTDAASSASRGEATRPLRGLRILVVEDIGMVAMALKAMAEELGCVVVGTAARLTEATAIVERGALDGVLLDLNLDGEFSYPLAETLRSQGVPFIVMSGYDPSQRDPALAGVPWMQKPFEREALATLMQTVFAVPDGAEGEDVAESAGDAAPLAPESRRPRTPRSPPPHQPSSMPSSQQSSANPAHSSSPPPRKTRGEIESEICRGMCGFAFEYLGRGPKDVEAHLIGEMLVVRLNGVLTSADRHLAQSNPPKEGRDLIKAVRRALIEGARLQVESMVQLVTGVRVRSLHHDISTKTGDEIVVFTLEETPQMRVPTPR